MNNIGPWACAALAAFVSTAAAQVAILQIQVVEGEGAVHAPGSRSSRALAVEITDETGKPVEGAAVTFHLPDSGPGGTFANGLRTEVQITDSRGRAAVHGMQWNRTAGRFAVRIFAAREQAHAGTLSFQYIAEPESGAAHGTPPAAVVAGHRRRKWMVLAGAAAGGAVVAILAGRSGGGAAQPGTAASTIGTPTITIGKP